MTNIESYNENIFEKNKNLTEDGQEFWYARKLAELLEYSKWGNFEKVIDKAKTACEKSGYLVGDNFIYIEKKIPIGSGSERKIDDIMLSRYASYLIVQSADTRKTVVAQGQTYFTIQTRKQEKLEEFEDHDEEAKRLLIRKNLKEHNKKLVNAAHNAGVETPIQYSVFQNAGYQGLYGGLKSGDIKIKKNLTKSQKILDYMGSTELAANLFRATQTEDKLRRDKVKSRVEANKVHNEVGKKVRKTIEELGGTMPEELPTPKKSVKEIEKEQKKMIEKENKSKLSK